MIRQTIFKLIRRITPTTLNIIILVPILTAWIPVPCTVADEIENRSEPYELAPLVVTATRSPIAARDVSANVTVITSEQLDQMPATTVAQALTYIPGVSVEFNGGPGSDAGEVSIQGSETRHVAVYQDGVPLSQLVNPRTDLSYLPLASIERIEIFKGAASSAWGSALGGVINIVTKNPSADRPVKIDAQGSYGTHATLKSKASVSGTHKDLGWLATYTYEESDGFIENTQYRLNAAYAKLNYALSDSTRLNFALTHNQGQNADPILNWQEFSTERFWDDIDRQLDYQRLLLESRVTDDLVLTVEGRHRQIDSTVEDVYADRREQYQNYEEELWGASARMNWRPTDTHSVSAGLDSDWGRFDWKPISAPRKTDDTGDWAVFANDTVYLSDLTINAGSRYDNNKDYGSAVSPSLGAIYHFSIARALIRSQVAKGFSAPNFAWVNDPDVGNPSLTPEQVINYQLGGEIYPLKCLRATLNLFKADVKDLIRYDGDANTYVNTEKVTRMGFEWALDLEVGGGLAIGAGGNHTDVRDKLTDTVIQDIPRKQYHVSLRYAGNAMSHSLLGKYIDNNSSYEETRDKVTLVDYQFKYMLPVTAKKGKWALYAAVYNLFNTTYLIRDVWPQPNRRGEAGISMTF